MLFHGHYYASRMCICIKCLVLHPCVSIVNYKWNAHTVCYLWLLQLGSPWIEFQYAVGMSFIIYIVCEVLSISSDFYIIVCLLCSTTFHYNGTQHVPLITSTWWLEHWIELSFWSMCVATFIKLLCHWVHSAFEFAIVHNV